MGMYDTIKFNCPKCNKEIMAQSKSGNCSLGMYEYTSVPIDVAYDANRHAPFECECGSIWYFDISVIPKLENISLPIIGYKGLKNEKKIKSGIRYNSYQRRKRIYYP